MGLDGYDRDHWPPGDPEPRGVQPGRDARHLRRACGSCASLISPGSDDRVSLGSAFAARAPWLATSVSTCHDQGDRQQTTTSRRNSRALPWPDPPPGSGAWPRAPWSGTQPPALPVRPAPLSRSSLAGRAAGGGDSWIGREAGVASRPPGAAPAGSLVVPVDDPAGGSRLCNAWRHRRTAAGLRGGRRSRTGKTTTVARLLALLDAQAVARALRPAVALAAPTGKAAARLEEAVRSGATPAHRSTARWNGCSAQRVTLHRLLGLPVAIGPGSATTGEPAAATTWWCRRDVHGAPVPDGPPARCPAPRRPADHRRRP